MKRKAWAEHNPGGAKRVVVTKELPGKRWLDILVRADCRVKVGTATDILAVDEIIAVSIESGLPL